MLDSYDSKVLFFYNLTDLNKTPKITRGYKMGDLGLKSKVIFLNVPENKFAWSIYHKKTEGNGGHYSTPTHDKFVIERIRTIQKMFHADGSWNISYRKAECYALGLAFEKKYEAALELFETIVGNSKDILLVGSHGENLEPVANMPGKLGYEGVAVYAQICCLEKINKIPLALHLSEEIVSKVNPNSHTERLHYILLDSLVMLQRYGVKKIGEGKKEINIVDRLDALREKLI